jgi:hypothetical protein
MRRTWFSTRLAAIALAALLPAACGDDNPGGGGETPDAPPDTTPDGGTPPPVQVLKRPSSSKAIAISDDDKFVVMVNPDNDSISVFQTSDFGRTAVVPVGKEPSSVTKMAIGCFVLGLSFIVMVVGAQMVGSGKGSLFGPVFCTLMLTVGVLYLSPIGPSLVTNGSPARIVSSRGRTAGTMPRRLARTSTPAVPFTCRL